MVSGSVGTLGQSSDTLTVLYDADCGICTEVAKVLKRLDRGRRLSLTPLQTAAQRTGPTQQVLLESLHAVDELGRWWVGPAAALEIAERVPILRPLAWLSRMPLAYPVIDAGYSLIARNRHQLSRLLRLDACLTPVETSGAPSQRSDPNSA